MRIVGATLLVLLLTGGSSTADDLVSQGKRLFAYCYACHSVEPWQIKGLPGPNLAGIIGRPIASQEDFDYSPAMRRFAKVEERWTEPLLDRFLAGPETAIPGTWMSSPPLSPLERSAVIAYLKAVSVTD